MNLHFRQGIITNGSIAIAGNMASVTSEFLVTLSERTTDYLVKVPKSSNVWLVDNQKAWLYIDISKNDAALSFGSATIDPFVFSVPLNPMVGQMYYDTNEYTFKEWSGQFWVDVLRVFVGTVENGILTKQSTGSQVNVYTQSVPDYIVFSTNGLPIKNYNDNTFTFYTKTTITNFKRDRLDTLSYARVVRCNGNADSDLSSYKLIGWSDYNTLQYANPISIPAIGISEVDATTGELLSFHYDGFIENKNWHFTDTPNTSLFLSNDGELTTYPNLTNSLQRVGYVVSPTIIYVDIGDTYIKYTPVIDIPSPSPTPTPAPTPTPTPPISNSLREQIIADGASYYWVDQDTTDSDTLVDIVSSNNATFANPQGQQATLFGNNNGYVLTDAYGAYANIDGNENGTLNAAVPLSTNFTLESWVMLNTGQDYPTIFGDIRIGSFGLQFYADSANAWKLMYDGNVYFEPDYIFSTNVFYHIVICVDNLTVDCYVNGQLVPTLYNQGSDVTLTDMIDFQLGFIGTDADGELFAGLIGDPAVYNLTLDAGKVNNHYTLGKAGRYT